MVALVENSKIAGMTGKRSLLACHTRCKCSIETTHNSVKVKLGTKVKKLVEILIGLEVTLHDVTGIQ